MSNETIKPTHGVFYGDGGCDNPTIAGYGIHAYLFTNEPAKQGTGNPKALPTSKCYEMGGSGKPEITLTHYIDGFSSITQNATNNVAELGAGIKVLEMTKEWGLKHTTMVFDSKYVLDGFDKWMHDWSKNNWVKPDGSPRSNADLWKRMLELKQELKDAGVEVKTHWVKGHSGELGNERADSLAGWGKMAARNGAPTTRFNVKEAKGYWSPKSERNRMLSLPNWYFAAFTDKDAEKSKCGRHVYSCGTIREKSELIGKAISDASFSVSYLRERDAVLDIVMAGAEDLYVGRPQGVFIAYLDLIFKPAMYEQLADYGRILLIQDRRGRHLSTKVKVNRNNEVKEEVLPVLEEVDPPGLSFRLIDHLGQLRDRLDSYLEPKEGGEMRINDITHLIYEIGESKGKTTVKLNPKTITTATRSIEVDGSYAKDAGEDGMMKFLLTLAQDLPDRNTLNALGVEGVKVSLLTWPESGMAVRFATVIEANGDVGIWAGPYSNLQIVPI